MLELVEGETLTDRIARGPIPLEEALDIARQVAEALEAAHEAGIIHRDLKPANVIVHPEGLVKVLDFGLAKALQAGAENEDLETSPTLSFAATRAGVILGTAAYMSPEQARGHEADRRSDIWSFGVVLYEMASGKRLFDGDTPSDVLARVLTSEPDWSVLGKSVPKPIVALLRRCLTRERKARLQAIGEARIAIETYASGSSDEGSEAAVRAGRSRLWPAMSLVLAAGLAAAMWTSSRSTNEPAAPKRLAVELDAGGTGLFDTSRLDGASMALSPDGTKIVFVGRSSGGERQLFLRALDRLDATAVEGTEGARTPFFSPDGRWIAYFAQQSLRRISLDGGTAPVTITSAVPDPRGGTWGTDGTIVFAPSFRSGLSRVSASGGTPEVLTELGAGERSHRWPWFLPEGQSVVFINQAIGGDYDDAAIEIVRLDTRERTVVHQGGTYPRFVAHQPSGQLLFVRESTLFAVPFDDGAENVSGEPTPLMNGIRTLINGAAQYSASNDTLIYAPGGPLASETHFAVADRSGSTTILTEAPQRFRNVRLAPDESRVVLGVDQPDGSDLYSFELASRRMSRLTFQGPRNANPIWTPDGERIVFGSNRQAGSVDNLYWKRADGGDEPERLTTSTEPQRPVTFTPDGTRLVYNTLGPETGQDIWSIDVDGDRTPVPVLVTPNNEQEAALSPDGRWIAYASDESGQNSIYIQPYPELDAKYQAPGDVGRMPRWTREGRELIYAQENRLVAVGITVVGGALRVGEPRVLFSGEFAGFGPNPFFDVSSDGERFFLFPRVSQEEPTGTHVIFVFDFLEELRRLSGD